MSLTAGYTLVVRAKNGDGIMTDFSNSSVINVPTANGVTPPAQLPPPVTKVCQIDCSDLVLKPYIVNPIGNTISLGNKYVKVKNIKLNVDAYYFEDNGSDLDYNDAVVQIDKQSCRSIKVTMIEHNALWHHQIKVIVGLNNTQVADVLVWPNDSVIPPNTTKILDTCTLLGY
jgi:hypothetical protein